MPKRTDIKRVLVIGSGPIVIGQACEFDYSGTQACKALRAEGLEVILVNSNPATIMTDPELADRTYVEPLTPEVLAQDHRARAARRGAADGRRADRAQPRGRARRERHAREVRRRADRRVGSRRSRSPRTGCCSATRCATIGLDVPREPLRPHDRGGDGRGRDARLPEHHPAVVHARRRRRRHRLQHRGVPRARRPRPRAEPGARNPGRGVGDRLEGVRARGDARPAPTTSSSSARSRTSIRWACTPATASPSRRR